jgi:hypothetical protein
VYQKKKVNFSFSLDVFKDIALSLCLVGCAFALKQELSSRAKKQTVKYFFNVYEFNKAKTVHAMFPVLIFVIYCPS